MDGASFVCVKNLRVFDRKTGLKNGKEAIFKGLSVACPPYGARSFGHLAVHSNPCRVCKLLREFSTEKKNLYKPENIL